MKKDFQKWHLLKSKIDTDHNTPLFREREIWWCSLGANVGVEEDGKNDLFERPMLVFRKFNKEMFWGLPITSKKKLGKFYFSFPLFNVDRSVILSQMRVLSGKRLLRRLHKISDKQFALLNDALIDLTIKTDPLRSPRVPNGNL